MIKVRFSAEVKWVGCYIEDEIVEFEDGTDDHTIYLAWVDWYVENTGGGCYEVIEDE